jgi:hypothetical protein
MPGIVVRQIDAVRCKCGQPAMGGSRLCAEHEAMQDERMVKVRWKQPKDMIWANGLLPGRKDFVKEAKRGSA